MRVADVLTLFDSDAVFSTINRGPLELSRYAGATAERWTDSPGAKWIAIAQAAHSTSSLTDSWESVFSAAASATRSPQALVVMLVDDLELTPVGRVLHSAEHNGFQLVAVLPLRYEVISAAVVAVPTESAISLNRWLSDDPIRPDEDSSMARMAYSQLVLTESVRRAATREEAAETLTAESARDNLIRTRVAAAEADARKRERHANANHKAEIETFAAKLAIAELKAAASDELFKSVKRSSAYRLGNLLGKSARHPLGALAGFPRGLAQIVRERGMAAEQAEKAKNAVEAFERRVVSRTRPHDLKKSDEPNAFTHLRGPYPPTPTSSGPKVAYISHPVFGGVRRSGWQFDLLPNTAIEMIERWVPRAIVIDASAFQSGSPWAGAATWEDPNRTKEVADVLAVAHRYGIACVFRWDSQPENSPGMIQIAEACDVAVSSVDVGRTTGPILQRGVVVEGHPLKHLGVSSNSISAFPTHDPLASLADWTDIHPWEQISSHLPADWEARAVSDSMLHKPRALEQLFARSDLTWFPVFDQLSVPVLESLRAGVPVIGARQLAFADVIHPDEIEWSDEAFQSMRQSAIDRLPDTRWSIREGFSTVAETRTIGSITGIEEFRDLGSITAVVMCNEPTDETRLDLLQSSFDYVRAVVSIGPNSTQRTAARIAAAAETRGLATGVARTPTEVLSYITALSPQCGLVWLIRLNDLADESSEVLKRHLMDSHSKSISPIDFGQVLSADDLADIGEEAARILFASSAATQEREK